ncbi:discoidin domain-containing protein [Nocardia abscessus]|uniref:discoidin domain-containing protein n=1 Tax=Nocardia abscessus TaxID=120957 RepID=UPI002455FD43|nr:discoidin domain-containing protein [Nocardia abscessus]
MSATIPQYTATTTDGTVNNASPLHFDLNTNPDPVRVSPSTGDPQRADFVLVGSRRSISAIQCRKITVTVPTGNNSPDLTPDLNSVSADISLPGWTPVTNTNSKTITFTPASGHAEIGRDQGVTIQLMGMRINTVVGSAPLRIDLEWREAGDDNEPWASGTVVFDIGKFPPDFHVANFMADPLIIDNNGAVKLEWEASGVSSLRLLYDAADINVLNLTTYPVNNITRTTVFYLRATVQVGTNTVERTLSVTVTVLIPDLDVGRLTVHKEIAVVAQPAVADVSERLGAAEEHPPELMLDGSRTTYYLSATHPQRGDYVLVDLREIRWIRRYFIVFGVSGANTGRPPAGRLEASTDGTSWTELHTFRDGVIEFAGGSPGSNVRARYVRLIFDTSSSQPVAVRSFGLELLEPLRITATTAQFGVPLIADDGITQP